ncbi:MAG: hypothetical protein AB8B61_08365 [Cyclobacteriaceae bacterium]
MRVFLATLALGITFLISPAKRPDFLPGHVITLEGDTLKGFTKKSKFQDQREIAFKSTTDEEKNFTPTEIAGFTNGLETYFSIPTKELDYVKNIQDSVIFIQELIKGPVSLYKYSFCYQAKTYGRKWTDRNSYKKNCQTYEYLRKEGENYFLGYIQQAFDIALIGGGQPIDNFRLAGYFDEADELAKRILYKVYKQNQLLLIAQEYNKWVKEGRTN